MNTISHEKIRTTIVRMAVATVESVLRMPHLASTAVSPANSAEPNAYKIHMMRHLPFNLDRQGGIFRNSVLCAATIVARSKQKERGGRKNYGSSGSKHSKMPMEPACSAFRRSSFWRIVQLTS